MGRPFEALISDAPGFLSRRNAIILVAAVAGSVLTLQEASAGIAPVANIVAGTADVSVTTGGEIELNGQAIQIEAGSNVPTVITAIMSSVDGSISVDTNGTRINLVVTSGGPLVIAGHAQTLAELGLAAGTFDNGSAAIPATPEGYRPFSVGDGDTPDLKVAVLMRDAKAGIEEVVIDRLAEVKAAKIVVADAAREEAIAALEAQDILVR